LSCKDKNSLAHAVNGETRVSVTIMSFILFGCWPLLLDLRLLLN